MKLEFLESGSPDCPLIRIFDFTNSEAIFLCERIAELASGSSPAVEVHNLPSIEPIAGCHLTLRRCSWDQAAVRIGGSPKFECGFTAETWDNIAGRVKELVQTGFGHQWLGGLPGEARILMSFSGQW